MIYANPVPTVNVFDAALIIIDVADDVV